MFNVLVSFMFYGVLSDLISFETFWFKLDCNLLMRLICFHAFKKPTHPTPIWFASGYLYYCCYELPPFYFKGSKKNSW